MSTLSFRQKIGRYLRKTGLLSLVNYGLFVRDVLANWSDNRAFLKENPGFVPPPLFLAYDAYNHTNWRLYVSSGQRHASLIGKHIRGNIDQNDVSILEWGCGPGRVIRHLDDIQGFSEIRLNGSDYNPKTIEWCNKSITGIRFRKNTLEPPLPFEDNEFDVVYALSVFTHLSESMHHAWVEELHRVLRPGGILMFTTHGHHFTSKLSDEEQHAYDSGSLVVLGNVKEGSKGFAAFHPESFVRSMLNDRFDIKSHVTEATEYSLRQDLWVAAAR